MAATPPAQTELRRTVHRLMLEMIPHEAKQPKPGTLVRLILPKVSGTDEQEVRRIVNDIMEEPASGLAFDTQGRIQHRLTPAAIYAMHRDMKQHLAAPTLRSPSGRPMVECRVFVEAMKPLVLSTSDGTAIEMLKQFYHGVPELFGEEWAQEQVHVGGNRMYGRSLQDLPDKASIVARNRDLIAALEEGSTAVPFPPSAPAQLVALSDGGTAHGDDEAQAAQSPELRRVVYCLMMEAVPRTHALPSLSALTRILSLKIAGLNVGIIRRLPISVKVLRAVINRIVQEPGSGFAFNDYGKIQRRLTPAEIYAMHRDMKQHLAASTLRSPSGRPMVECCVFVESMKTLVLTTSDRTASAMCAQFYNGVPELFGEKWVEGSVKVRGTTTHGRSLQDLPDKASIVARNRGLIAALEEGSTAVPFPPPAPQVALPGGGTAHRVVRDPAQNQPDNSAEVRNTVHRVMLETVPHTHSTPTLACLVRFVSPKVPGIDQKALRSVINTIMEDPTSGFVWTSSHQIKRRLTPAEIYAVHRGVKQRLVESALRSPSGVSMVESRMFVESMKTLVLTTSEGTAARVVAQFYKGVSELFGEQWVEGYVYVRGKKTHGRTLQDLPDKASIVARNRDLIAALEEGSTAVPFPPPAPLPAEAPAVAAPAVQRRGRGVAPKRQREAGPSDTEGRRAAHT